MRQRDYTQFKGKKILLLGAHTLMMHLVEKAHEMGMYVIVTDYIKDAPAKKIADEAYDISTLDVAALIKLAKEKQVDAVYTAYVDINLAPCCEICNALGLPFYATLKQLDETMNKVHFKNNCRKFGIRVANDVNPELLDGIYDKIDYPVIVKPADSYSSKGISVCSYPEEMQEALNKAMDKSNCKEIVVEEFIDAQDVYLYFTVQNGLLSLSAMADRLLNNDQYGCAPQPMGYSFPSKYIDIYYDKVHKKLQKMMDNLEIRNGSFFMQGFIVDNDIIFFEMGLRLTGGAGYLQIRKQNQIDQTEMHLRYAVTGKFDGWDLKTYDNPRFRHPAYVFVILLKNGKIDRIEGLDDVLEDDSVFDIVQFKSVGDVLDARGTLNQVFARIYMENESKDKLDQAILNIKNKLKIYDEKGNNMILNY